MEFTRNLPNGPGRTYQKNAKSSPTPCMPNSLLCTHYMRAFFILTHKKRLFDAFFLLYTTKPTNLLASFCHEMSAVLTTNLPSIKKNFDCFEKMGQESPSPSLSLLSGSLHFLTGIKVRTHTWSKKQGLKKGGEYY